MQKGGNDFCGTCNYNELKDAPKNGKGRARKARCTLRKLTIEQPSQKYCINHPHHNPGRIKEPVGPVFQATGHPHRQAIGSPAQDSPEIRSGLLGLLRKMTARRNRLYYSPTETVFDVVVLNHLGDLKEKTALPGILEVLKTAESEWLQPSAGMPTVTQAYVIRAALQATIAISEDESLPLAEQWLHAVKVLEGDRYVKNRAALAVIRLGLVEALGKHRGAGTLSLPQDTIRNPGQEICKPADALMGKAA